MTGPSSAAGSSAATFVPPARLRHREAVPPTRARLDKMLEVVREPERSFGHLAPLYGELTPVAVIPLSLTHNV